MPLVIYTLKLRCQSRGGIGEGADHLLDLGGKCQGLISLLRDYPAGLTFDDRLDMKTT